MRVWALGCAAVLCVSCSSGDSSTTVTPSPQRMAASPGVSTPATPVVTATARPVAESTLMPSDVPLPQFPGALVSGVTRTTVPGPDRSSVQITLCTTRVNGQSIDAIVDYYKERCPELKLHEAGNGKVYLVPPSVKGAGEIPTQGERIEIAADRDGGIRIRLESYEATLHE